MQERLLLKALAISGCEQYSIERLQVELSTSELRLLEENMRNGASNNLEKNRTSGVWQNIKGKKNFLSQRRKEPLSLGSVQSQSVAEVKSLTRNAIKRSVIATPSDGDCASEITDDTDVTDTSGDGSEKKRNHLFSLQKRDSVRKAPMSPRPTWSISKQFGSSSTPSLSPREARSDSGRSLGSQNVSEWARQRGLESYEAGNETCRQLWTYLYRGAMLRAYRVSTR